MKESFSFGEFAKSLPELINRASYRPNISGYKPQGCWPHPKQCKLIHSHPSDERERYHPQQRFHRSPAKNKLFVGGNRSGKTVAGACEAIWWASKTHPFRELPPGPIRGRAISVDFVNGLDKIMLPEIRRWIAPSMLVNGSWEDSFNRNSRVLTFANESFIEFLSYDQDLDKHAGTSRHFCWFDEEPPQAIYDENMMRLVDTKGSYWMTLTPVEEGSLWLIDDILEPYENGVPEIRERWDVFKVDTRMNTYIDNEEIIAKTSHMSKEDRDTRMSGIAQAGGGKIFPMLSKAHIVKAPPVSYFKNYKNRVWVGLDPGQRVAAMTWHLVAENGLVWTFHEQLFYDTTIRDMAEAFNEYNHEMHLEPELVIADPAVKQKTQSTGYSIQTEYAMHGVDTAIGNNSVDLGLYKMKEYLHTNRWIISEDCPMLYQNLKKYRYMDWGSKKLKYKNDLRPQPHKKDDHDIDSCRYVFSFMPDLTEKQKKKKYENPALQFEMPAIAMQMTYDFDGGYGYQDPRYAESMMEKQGYVVDEYLGSEW